jgi:hypothetical protein
MPNIGCAPSQRRTEKAHVTFGRAAENRPGAATASRRHAPVVHGRAAPIAELPVEHALLRCDGLVCALVRPVHAKAHRPSPVGPRRSALAGRPSPVGPRRSALAGRPSPVGPRRSALAGRPSPVGPRRSALAGRPSPIGPRRSALADRPSPIGRRSALAVRPSPVGAFRLTKRILPRIGQPARARTAAAPASELLPFTVGRNVSGVARYLPRLTRIPWRHDQAQRSDAAVNSRAVHAAAPCPRSM